MGVRVAIVLVLAAAVAAAAAQAATESGATESEAQGATASTTAATEATTSAASAAEPPETWPRCRRRDPNRDFCLRHAIQVSLPQMATGIPELDLPPVEGTYIKEEFPIEQRPGRISLKVTMSNTYSHGLSQMKINSVFSNLDNGVIDIHATMPVSIVNADVEVEGSILHEPVSPQKGTVNFTFTDVDGIVVVSGKNVERDGDSFLDVDFARWSILSLGSLSVYLDPLDNAPQRSSKLNYLLNSNALAWWPDIRDALQTIHAQEFLKLAKRIFSKVPLKNIFLSDDHPAVLAGPSSLLFYGR